MASNGTDVGAMARRAWHWWKRHPWAKKMLKRAIRQLKPCFGGHATSGAAHAAHGPSDPAAPQPGAWSKPQPYQQPHPQPSAVQAYVPAPVPGPPPPVPYPAPQTGDVAPTAAELADLSLVAQRLYDLDDNRLRTGTDYALDVGSGKRVHEVGVDAAGNRLFRFVTPGVWDRPTFRALYALRDNYNAATGVTETETAQESAEVTAFLDAIVATRPMRYAHNYLVGKGLAPPGDVDFKRQLYQMWFSLYRREQQNDSCGFEHVFLGELDGRSGEVSGFHNWVQFWVEEGKGAVDYKGYIQPRNRREVVDDADRVLALQFTWQGKVKNVTTMFIGSSPEFELALYTVYFLAGQERNVVNVAGYELCIRCYAIHSQYGNKVGSAFPELVSEVSEHHS